MEITYHSFLDICQPFHKIRTKKGAVKFMVRLIVFITGISDGDWDDIHRDKFQDQQYMVTGRGTDIFQGKG